MADAIKLGNSDVTFKVGSTDVDKIYLGSTLLYPSTPHDYSQDYLTFENVDNVDVTIYFRASSNTIRKTVYISTDGGSTWYDRTTNTGTSGVTLATLSSGEKMLVKGSNTAYGNSANYNFFKASGKIKVSGNIMSLIYGDDFIGKTSFSSSYTFKELFENLNNLINAKNLILPATKVLTYSYYNMFRNCKFTTAPELPATTLDNYCYYGMFFGTNITTAPVLPATTLADYCYYQMFGYCSSLTTPPTLPATTLADYCYQNMFQNCTSLVSAPELPATTLAISCYRQMFQGCNRLTTAPELPATTLTDYCYRQMFASCTSLNNITCLATDISASNCTTNWLNIVSSTGTFTKAASMSSWTTGVDGIPTNWTVQNYSS